MTAREKTFGVIKRRWERCSLEQQRVLLDRYLKLEYREGAPHWLDFLAAEFDLAQTDFPENGAQTGRSSN